MREFFRMTYEDGFPSAEGVVSCASAESDQYFLQESGFCDKVIQWWRDVVASVQAGWRQACFV